MNNQTQQDNFVKIVEVGPRDGLQNEPNLIPTAAKIHFINLLSETGLSFIEATSFVSHKKIPQLADAFEVIAGIEKNPKVHYSVLVPNEEGLDTAKLSGIKEIAVFAAASETFSQKNINCSITESLERYERVVQLAKAENFLVRGYISCCLGCPYEGKVDVHRVAEVALSLKEMGCDEISLGDTIGVGTPKKAVEMIKAVHQSIPLSCLAAHFHDTYGQALANIYAILEYGIRIIDSSIAGLGGCPYALGATGNVATEDVLYLLEGLGLKTGVDWEKIFEAGRFICTQLNKEPESRVARAKGKYF